MKKKVIIVGIIVLVIISIIMVGIFLKKAKECTDIENEVITIINNLNSNNGAYGDWNKNLHIVKVNEVKKVDTNLLYEEDKEEIDENASIFVIKLEEVKYGNIEICVVNGEVTANSILGETIEDYYKGDIYTKDVINVDKINKKIE